MPDPAPTHLLMDLTGVLAGSAREVRLRALAGASGREPSDVDQLLYGSGQVDRWHRGEADADGVRDGLRTLLGLRGPDEEVDRLWLAGLVPDDEVLAVVDQVLTSVPRALLTNDDALVADALPRLVPALARRFSARWFSGDVHATLPSAHAYLSALAGWEVSPQEVLFVDDGEENVAGAQRCGLQALRFTTATRLRADLDERGLLAP